MNDFFFNTTISNWCGCILRHLAVLMPSPSVLGFLRGHHHFKNNIKPTYHLSEVMVIRVLREVTSLTSH